MDLTVENVLHAVHSMYSSAQPANYKEIDNWLKGYQKSAAAWSLVGAIFGMQGLPEYVYIFNAQTLKTKLMFDFEELKGMDVVSFKSNLLALCLQFASLDKVMRQLAQCVGVLALHISDLWGPTMFSELSSAFGSQVLLLLEVLKSIAEEISNQTIVVDTDKVDLLKNLLIKQSTDVITFLETCSAEKSLAVLEVFLAWVQFGLGSEIAVMLPRSRLLMLSFEAIQMPDKFETACGVLCELISLTEDYQTHGETVKAIVGFLVSIKGEARRYIQDESVIDGYVKLYTTLGNTHLKRMLEENSTDILEFLVELFLTKSYDAIYYLSQFWHRFCRMYNRKPPEEKQQQAQLMNYLMERLLPVCIQHFQLSADELNKKIDNNTKENRYNISVVLGDVSEVLGVHSVLSLLNKHLVSVLQGSASDYDKFSQIEAVACCVCSIAEIIEDNVPEPLLQLFQQLCSAIWQVRLVNSTICSIFVRFNGQIHSQVLGMVLDFLVKCLKAEVSPNKVAAAIKNVCVHNSKSLTSSSADLLLIQKLAQTLPEKPHELLLEGISAVLWRASVENRHIVTLCSEYAKNLIDCSNDEVLLTSCDRIAVIFKSSFDKDIEINAVYALFKEIWPQLQLLVARFESNDNAVEVICRIVKHVIKKLQAVFGEFLEDFLVILTSQFLKYKHSSYLYMAEQLVKIFASSNLHETILMNLFNTLTSAALAVLNSAEALANNPELTEDFFGMVTRYLHYLPSPTLRSASFESILALGKTGIGLQQTEAAKCLYSFLEVTFDFCNKEGPQFDPYAVEKLLGYYRDVLINLIATVVITVSGRIYEFIEELIYKILIVEEGPRWLEQALVQVPHDCLTEGEKVKFVQQSHSSLHRIHDWLEKLYRRAKARAMRFR